MENKNIIIILLIVVVILAAVLGFMFLNKTNPKDSTKIKITSDKSQYEDSAELSIKLTDMNGTALSKEIVNITITDKKGKVVADDVVKTNSKGNAKLDLNLKKGKYSVNVTYDGNENFTANHSSQNLTIKEEASTSEVSSGESQSSSGTPYDINNLPPTNDPYPETNRYYIDENYIKQEYADGYMRTVDVRTGEVHSLGFK
ncbi:Ig-like domain repeat protein [uncultured Methanobrevibacter sp.]|uniref:Ig-like domain repeat protein n=1 Tax=uncultured Methanobrevibacter sp. TaxID=253161 RepID=UPI0025ECC954|nr:type IV pilin [uncultured Methanobrevibacter sp.]